MLKDCLINGSSRWIEKRKSHRVTKNPSNNQINPFKGNSSKNGMTILTITNESINHFVSYKVLNLHN